MRRRRGDWIRSAEQLRVVLACVGNSFRQRPGKEWRPVSRSSLLHLQIAVVFHRPLRVWSFQIDPIPTSSAPIWSYRATYFQTPPFQPTHVSRHAKGKTGVLQYA